MKKITLVLLSIMISLGCIYAENKEPGEILSGHQCTDENAGILDGKDTLYCYCVDAFQYINVGEVCKDHVELDAIKVVGSSRNSFKIQYPDPEDPSTFNAKNIECGSTAVVVNRGPTKVSASFDEEKLKSSHCQKCGPGLQAKENSTTKKFECVNTDYNGSTTPKDPDYGLRCDPTKLLHGNCGMHIYDMLGIRQSNPNTTPDEFVQDIVLTLTTFIGTILTFALVVSGLMVILGGASENMASKGRRGIQYALIGYVIVLCSYFIIRLIQYIAG